MEKKKLDDIIVNHVKWLQCEGGKCAHLCMADLEGADLCMVDLEKANLRGANLRRAKMYRANLKGADICRANLEGGNLRRADLEGANLEGAGLEGADLEKANLCGAHLEGADLEGAYLRGADLEGAHLEGAHLCMADLEGAELPVDIYQIVGAGGSNRCTTYDVINDQIVCGCWDDGKGNHLDSFIKRIEMVYGINGESPNQTYYAEYMAGISFFKAMKELKENHDRQRNKGD